MKRVSIFIIVILAAITVGSIANSRGAGKALKTSLEQCHTLSNDLATANAQLREKGAANETLRVQHNLSTSDLVVLSNRVAKLESQLKAERESLAASNRSARAVQLALDESNGRLGTARQEARELDGLTASLREQLAKAEHDLREARNQGAELSKRLNTSETLRSELLQKWNDPAMLRAQVRDVDQGLPSPGNIAPVGRAELVLQDDGTVREQR